MTATNNNPQSKRKNVPIQSTNLRKINFENDTSAARWNFSSNNDDKLMKTAAYFSPAPTDKKAHDSLATGKK